jgi:tetratricopeptide (TPR) repeat protein
MAQGTGDPMLKVTGHHAIGYTHFYRGEYEAALRHAADGLSLFELDRERAIAKAFLFSSSCALWCSSAQANQVLGNAAKATESYQGARRLDEDLHHAPSRVYLMCLCYFHRMAHDVAKVRQTATTLGILSVAEGFHFWKLVSDVFLAWADAQSGGDATAAATTIREVRREIHQGLTHLVDSEQGAMEAEVLLLANRPEEAFRATKDALNTIAQGKQRHAEADLFRLQGDAAARMGETQQALALYRKGIASARGMGARLLELRCALSLARLRGGPEERADVKRAADALVGASGVPEYEQALAFLDGRDTQASEKR